MGRLTQSGMGRLTTKHLALIFRFFKCLPLPPCVWPAALKLGCVTNFDMLSLMMGLISLVNEI